MEDGHKNFAEDGMFGVRLETGRPVTWSNVIMVYGSTRCIDPDNFIKAFLS